MSSSDNVVAIKSLSPFSEMAIAYLERGWNPIPLPPGRKFPPPPGWTGKEAPEVTVTQIVEWAKSNMSASVKSDADSDVKETVRWRGEKSSMGLRLSAVVGEDGSPLLIPDPRGVDYEDVEAEIIGIDVDAYEVSDGERKRGDETIASWEARLGALPPTWISSGRANGLSGIRYYLVPVGYSWRASLGLNSSVDVIQKGHRFAAVYPSYHPKGGQYLWYRPGCAPTGLANSTLGGVGDGADGSTALGGVGDAIPRAWELPLLPPAWVEALTSGFMKWTVLPIDMDSSVDEVVSWARKTFKKKGGRAKVDAAGAAAGLEELGCSKIKERVKAWSDEIDKSDDSHNVLLPAHWNLLLMGLEGHGGWMSAAKVIDHHFFQHVSDAGKRGKKEAIDEAFRSRINALRKIKAKAEEAAATGVPITGRTCACYEGDSELSSEEGWQEFSDVINPEPKDPKDYERNDDGNADHLINLLGDNFQFVDGRNEWIFWDASAAIWRWDRHGMSRRAWRLVKRRQQKYAEQLSDEARRLAVMAGDDAGLKEDAKIAREIARKWRDFAERSGNNAQADNALKAAVSFNGVSVGIDKINHNPSLLGVANGVLELGPSGPVLRQGAKEDMVVGDTGVTYIPWSELLKKAAAGAVVDGVSLKEALEVWQDYLKTFLADMELRLWLQELMGYCLLGRNSKHKIIFLYGPSRTGKSTMLSAVMAALGSYASAESMDIFNPDVKNPQLVEAIDNRIITLSEADDGRPVSSSMLKRIASTDRVRARKLMSNDVIEKVASFTPVIATNHAPNVDKADKALDNRVVVVPFDTVVKNPDENKGARIEELCRVVVLSWMAEGWRLFCENGLRNEPKSESVLSAREEFTNEMSPLGGFLSEWVERTGNDDDLVAVSTLYAAYEKWCRAMKMDDKQRWNMSKFGRELTNAQIEKAKSPIRDEDGKLHKARKGIRMKRDVGQVVVFRVSNE